MNLNNIPVVRLLFLVFVLTVLASCGGDTNNNTNNNFPVVVVSDVHFDPFYDPSLFPALVAADVSEWEGIFKTSQITAPSAWGNDTNYPLFVLTLSSIKRNLGASPLFLPATFSGINFRKRFTLFMGVRTSQPCRPLPIRPLPFLSIS